MPDKDYMKVSEAATLWGISTRRVRLLCSEGRIAGAVRHGGLYLIPRGASKPTDGRLSATDACSPLLRQVDNLQRQLAACRPLSEGEVAALREEFLVEHTYNSNAIEGNTLTLQETALVLQGITIDRKPLRDHLEAVGYKEAFEYVEALAQEPRPLSTSDIHSLVLAGRHEDRGQWRRVPVTIMGALATPVQPYLIEPQMEQLLADMQGPYSGMHTVRQVALFHLRFEAIHPFIDGNGRTGRLLMNLQLIRAGLPPINVKFADRRRYYEAFDDFARTAQPTAMTTLVAEYLLERMQKMMDAISCME
ncbi:MAG: Fic family protein [Bacteroidales bacterium]|nr:Fic family protein [Bacteroidales bacterium]